MCGIAGFTGPGDQHILSRMTDILFHRGPNDRGTYYNAELSVFLGHRRLSIIDLAGGHQPMGNEDGTIQVVFNGEIYNHQELRAQLSARGHLFRSDHSDTEVLVHGFEEWGRELPARLNGMFAFAVFDSRNAILFMARDRFGEKPLYYCERPGYFAFASELKALLEHPRTPREISRTGMAKLFALGFIPGADTIIEGISKLPPGHRLELDVVTTKYQVDRYWEFKISTSIRDNVPDNELDGELRRLIDQAVKRRLMSDVPLGIFLSGGLDSSIILSAVAAQVPASRIHTFSIGFKEKSFDESSYARLVAAHFGTEHHEEQLSLNAARHLLMHVLDRMDEPLGDPSLLPTHLLARFASQHVTVSLGGDGGDELFAGYDPFLALGPAKFYSKLIPRCVHSIALRAANLLRPSVENMSFEFRLKRVLRGLSYPANLWNPVWLGPLPPSELSQLMGEEVPIESVYEDVFASWNNAGSEHIVDRTLEFYTRLYLPHNILTKVDRASMMVSLEARAPFLDNDLVDFAAALPHKYKLRGRTTKFLLKRAYAGRLPASVVRRKKKGFGIPLSAWLREWDDFSSLSSLPHVDSSWLESRWHEHRSGVSDHRQLLWCAISVDRFMKSMPRAVT